ncbi:hypothetical protein DUNSADRAFT_10779 [Dunaliella salina]|uniref:Borealin N-terminal domain-containing protein n=1 Tax=Dunaliella salina TaxID=3046 RepID=A0ABQ7GEK1_DUNSA|nr:hypothetical protein DUNSADRAFT_10779 [Dunaliella salina]|eukprot:KAF5833033.1 hypothetical protein DUNSADRAFT_10779 [Dunaliella salina]
MPPRKRKAPASRTGPQRLQTIAEEEGQGVNSAETAVSEARDSRGRTKDEAINHIADEVTERIKALQSTGRELACAVRLESQMACSRLPKKVQNMSVAEFFSLSPDEAKQTTLTNLFGRLMLLPGSKAGKNESLSAAPPPPQPPIPSTAAPTTRATRRTAARTGQQHQEQQHCAPTPPTATHPRATRAAIQGATVPSGGSAQSEAVKDQDQPGTSEPNAPPTEAHPATALPLAQQQQQEQQGQVHQAVVVSNKGGTAEPTHVLQDCTNLAPAAESGRVGQMLPPKRGARPGGKQAASQAEQEDAEAAQQAPVAATPAQHNHSMVAATPVGNSMNSTTHAQSGTATLATNFTLVKRTAARGRTGRRAGDDKAIMISTSDGRQFMVDAGTGVANIPDKYRVEVSAQLEVLHRLAGAALNV